MQNILQSKITLSIILLGVAINCTSNTIAMQPTNGSKINYTNKSTKIYFDGKRYTIDPAKKTKVTETINDMQPSINKQYLILILSGLGGGLLSGLIGGFFCNSTNSKVKEGITCLTTTLGALGSGGLSIYYFDYLKKNVHNYLNQEQNEYLSSISIKK